MYQKVSTDLNFVDREKQVEKFWKDQKIFEKSIDSRRKASYRPCPDPCDQGYDPQIPHHEGVYGSS